MVPDEVTRAVLKRLSETLDDEGDHDGQGETPDGDGRGDTPEDDEADESQGDV